MKNTLRFLILLVGLQCVAFGSSLSSFIRPGGTTTAVNPRGNLYTRDFGAVPDDLVDDTAALQSAFDSASATGKDLQFEDGNYLTSATLKTLYRNGYWITGAGARNTTITCTVDNIPIISLGNRILDDSPAFVTLVDGSTVTNDTSSTGWRVTGIKLTYTNLQSKLNHDANCLSFAGPRTTNPGTGWVQLFDGVVEDMVFNNGFYGMWTDPRKGWLPWGTKFDRLQFGSLSGGFIYFNGTGVAGPNNWFGTIYGRGDYCVTNNATMPSSSMPWAPALFYIKGYNTIIENYEVNFSGYVNGHTNGAMASGSAILTSTSADFSADDVGRMIYVRGAAAAGADLYTTIASYQSPTQITLAATNASGGAISSKQFGYGGPNTIQFVSGSDITVLACKEENFIKLNTSNFILMEANSRASFASMRLYGDQIVEVGTSVNLFAGVGVSKGLTIDRLQIGFGGAFTSAFTGGGTIYAFSGTSGTGKAHILGQPDMTHAAVRLSNVASGSHTVADSVYVDHYSNGLTSADKGDADYTFTLGDPSKVLWKTALTADRSLNLPSNNYLNPGNLEITVRRESTATGTGNLLIKDNGVTVASLPNPGSTAVLGWSRGSNGAGTGGGFRVLSITKPATPTLTTAQVLALTAAQSADYNEALVTDCLTFAGTSPVPAYWDGSAWRLTYGGAIVTTDLLTLGQAVDTSLVPRSYNHKGNLRWAVRDPVLHQGPTSQSGTGAGGDSTYDSTTSDRFRTMNTGTTATGYSYATPADASFCRTGNTGALAREVYLKARVFLSAASNGTDEYMAAYGLYDSVWSQNPLVGAVTVAFVVDRANTLGLGNTGNSVNYICVVRIGSVNYPLITSVTPTSSSSVPDLLEIKITQSAITFWINSVQVHQDTTHQIGSTFLRDMRSIIKSAGTTSRYMAWRDDVILSKHF